MIVSLNLCINEILNSHSYLYSTFNVRLEPLLCNLPLSVARKLISMDAEVTVLMMMKKHLQDMKNGFQFRTEMQILSLHRMVQNICFYLFSSMNYDIFLSL